MIGSNIMRRTFLAVSVMAALIVSGQAWAFDSTPYFPVLPPGSQWNYLIDDTTNSAVTVSQNTVLIPDPGGVQTSEFVSSATNAKVYNTSDVINGIGLHRIFAPDVNILGALADLTLTFSPPVIFAIADTFVGSIVNRAGAAEALFEFEGIPIPPVAHTYTASFTVIGFETVTVPAGIFDVLKVSGTINITGPLINQIRTSTFYHAQNIGGVKQVNTINGVTSTRVLTGSTLLPAAATNLVAAVLPSSRSAQVGTPVTALATIINAGGATATQCGLAPLLNSVNPLPITFSYNLNPPNGPLNTPVDIGPGSPQNYVFSVTANGAFASTDLKIIFDCTNTNPAPIFVGLTTLLISASASAVADIVALAATILTDGIVHIPTATGTGVFAVATVNVGGAGASITASADTGGAVLPVTLLICETIPATGQCMAAPAANVTTFIDPNETNTFGIFVTGSGNITFDPAGKRIFSRFKVGAATHGSTSVAVCTDTDPSCP